MAIPYTKSITLITYVLTTFKGTRPVIKELLSTNLMNKKAKAHEILCLFWNHHLRNSDFLLVISKLLYKKTQKRGVENWELCMIWWWWGIMMTSDGFGSTKNVASGTYPKSLRKIIKYGKNLAKYEKTIFSCLQVATYLQRPNVEYPNLTLMMMMM